MGQSKTTATNGDGFKLPDETREAYSDLKNDFAQLREDLKAMQRDLSTLTGTGASTLKGAFKTGVSAAEDKAHDAVEYASSELHEIQSQAQSAVRRNPLSSMAAALAIGYFISSLTKR